VGALDGPVLADIFDDKKLATLLNSGQLAKYKARV
jgi:hypothetical protein